MVTQVISRRVAVALAGGCLAVAGLATPASAHPRSWFANCTAVHQHWPHGIGKKHAHDHTTGTPVTNFKHNTRLYKHAMSINSDLDRVGTASRAKRLEFVDRSAQVMTERAHANFVGTQPVRNPA